MIPKEDITKFIDEHGNFTHTKIEGTKEQIQQLIDRYKETRHYKESADSQKLLMEHMLFPTIIETGMIPQGLLLELVMPSVSKDFKFNDCKLGQKITFDIPPQYRIKE